MIGNCSELRAIFVAGNPFVEIAAARASQLRRLSPLGVRGRALQEDLRAYRYQLLDLVPSLRFIDGEAETKTL